MMRLTGKITDLIGRYKFGFIKSDSVIDEIQFWEDGIFGEDNIRIPFSRLSIGALVDFTTEDYWSTKHNCFKKVSRDVRVVGISNSSNKKNKLSNISLKDKVIDSLDRIETVTNPYEFEDLVFTLLRLIGINKICQYDRKSSAGSADGVFISGNLCVVYDCTLRNPYRPHKDQQIFNYKNQLRSVSSITINETRVSGKVIKRTFVIPENREVWIITRGETRVIEKPDITHNICVKEVSIKSLIDVFNQKLDSQIFGKLDIT